MGTLRTMDTAQSSATDALHAKDGVMPNSHERQVPDLLSLAGTSKLCCQAHVDWSALHSVICAGAARCCALRALLTQTLAQGLRILLPAEPFEPCPSARVYAVKGDDDSDLRADRPSALSSAEKSCPSAM
jgi:hypothetical protein